MNNLNRHIAGEMLNGCPDMVTVPRSRLDPGNRAQRERPRHRREDSDIDFTGDGCPGSQSQFEQEADVTPP
jgi:hypothetical protein